jgi:hypothetical protein
MCRYSYCNSAHVWPVNGVVKYYLLLLPLLLLLTRKKKRPVIPSTHAHTTTLTIQIPAGEDLPLSLAFPLTYMGSGICGYYSWVWTLLRAGGGIRGRGWANSHYIHPYIHTIPSCITCRVGMGLGPLNMAGLRAVPCAWSGEYPESPLLSSLSVYFAHLAMLDLNLFSS